MGDQVAHHSRVGLVRVLDEQGHGHRVLIRAQAVACLVVFAEGFPVAGGGDDQGTAVQIAALEAWQQVVERRVPGGDARVVAFDKPAVLWLGKGLWSPFTPP